MTDITVALIAGGSSIIVGILTLIGVIFTNSKSNTKIEKQLEIAQAVTDEKIDTLSKNVEKHNKVIERVFKLETQEAVLQEGLRVANHRIKDLEGYHKGDHNDEN